MSTTAKNLPTIVMSLMAVIVAISVMSLYSDSRTARKQGEEARQATKAAIEAVRQEVEEAAKVTAVSIASLRERAIQSDKTNNEMHSISSVDRSGIHGAILENRSRIQVIETWITSQKKGASK